MKLNCIIIDDEPIARKILAEYIADIDFLSLIGEAENPVKATTLLNSCYVDLMFLDINMPKMSGMEFLRTSSSLPPAIMTTAYTEYAIDGYEFNILDYLVKPFSFERFLKACNKAKDYLKRNDNSSKAADHFFVKANGRIEKIFYDELIFIEAAQNYITLHTADKKIIVYLTLKGIDEQLPEHSFIKVHKSTIININKVKNIDANIIDLGTAKVVISQNLYDGVIKEILKDKILKR